MATHVGEYIADELKARRWSVRDLARRMGGNTEVDALTVDLLIHAAETNEPGLLLGDETAAALARGFGTSAEFWSNLHAAWRLSHVN